MKKLLNPLDIFLLGLSGAVTIFEEFKDPLDLTKAPYDDIYHWVHPRFRKTDYYQMTYHALKTGYIEKIIKNGESYFRLTSKGKEKTFRDFSLSAMQKKQWDRKWRVVIFDIDEKNRKNRDLLRNKLRELGFGMIQESVWISPHDIIIDFREFIKQIGLANQVFAMEVSGLLAGNEKALVSHIWNIDEINNDYQNLYKLLIKLHDREKSSITDNVEDEIRKVRENYLLILKRDPGLPKELLPNNWYGEKVKKLLK